ncbi:hypothetical protein LFS25_004284 [Salmonella enterica subsp. enterica serovar Typhimurium]|nr:hypothetical protein [Salmonella enterica subsp. enterica serovar Typhimurium]EIF3374625.1 hypothetical protein [Salmonella enterica subsp. enterica serovar Typhimurium]EII7208644.1 hypothetical protein [Salmonella enterica subsp. enterica serovar Typhimurium]EIP0078569.1 hypothetical protein [Salmonella enterica subsp. enterica serovar Typhimurium]EIW9447317.1 hypothetical protein [Salmonella enterica subsp. enterica serovar Typhimurium]
MTYKNEMVGEIIAAIKLRHEKNGFFAPVITWFEFCTLLEGREADHAENAQLRQRIADPEARPVAPFDFKETTDADYCREWAWREITKDLPTEHWKAGDNGTFYAFYLMGWHARLQYNEQRRAEYSQIAGAILKTRTGSVNTEPWRSFVSDDDITALNRFAECCDDPESGGHDLEKEQVKRLEKIGLLRRSGRISFTTDFGDFVLSAAGINPRGRRHAQG